MIESSVRDTQFVRRQNIIINLVISGDRYLTFQSFCLLHEICERPQNYGSLRIFFCRSIYNDLLCICHLRMQSIFWQTLAASNDTDSGLCSLASVADSTFKKLCFVFQPNINGNGQLTTKQDDNSLSPSNTGGYVPSLTPSLSYHT